MSVRHAEGYEPRFDRDYQYGRQGEIFVTDIVEALQNDRVEVKRDARYKDTGNLYVEVKCRRGGEWKKSGIATTEAEVWVFVLGDSEMCVVITTEALKRLVRQQWKNGRVAEERDGSHPTVGVLISASALLAWARERRKVA
jgi:hypothetical protein